MSKYYLTAFGKAGEHLVNETLEATSDNEAKEIGMKKLEEKELLNHSSRIVKSSGGLVHFHP
ncbi:hypothetical protein CR203_00235 [Salipaludibacillus neizhouensis]|uniref:YhzD-like protein n=1 Tax=Salipaludibacillus neizhouensis TaxID=885475 RepID=A0A3A9KG37_9BACI|nr:YhzD family protein [Salipaludibacillus neizhouensis]RKL68523.1 hypothetical protein CR203_00235 [Salipaludibacillus neizhouensis]